MNKLISGSAVAALFLALPLAANAQETVEVEGDVDVAVEAADICTATISSPVTAGEQTAVAVRFDAPFGDIVEIDAADESGLKLVDSDEDAELQNVADAAGNAELRDAATLDDANVSIFWLDAEEATVGTHEITLLNDSDVSCTTEITINDAIETDEVESMEEPMIEESIEEPKAETDEGDDY
jgi:hypothetical protein